MDVSITIYKEKRKKILECNIVLKSSNISVILTVSYQTGNNSLVLYDKTKFLPVPVVTKK